MLLLVLPHEVSGDGWQRYFALGALIEWRELSRTPHLVTWVRSFRRRSTCSRKPFPPTDWWIARSNTVVFIAGIAVAHRSLLRTRVDAAIRGRFPPVVDGRVDVSASSRGLLRGGVHLGAGRARPRGGGRRLLGSRLGRRDCRHRSIRLATVVALAASAPRHIWDTRRLRYVLPVVVAAAGIALESWIRRGSPFVSGYGDNHGDVTMLPHLGPARVQLPDVLRSSVDPVFIRQGHPVLCPRTAAVDPNRQPFVNEFVLRCYKLWMAFLAGLILVYAEMVGVVGRLMLGTAVFLFAAFPACLGLAVALTARRRATLPALLALSPRCRSRHGWRSKAWPSNRRGPRSRFDQQLRAVVLDACPNSARCGGRSWRLRGRRSTAPRSAYTSSSSTRGSWRRSSPRSRIEPESRRRCSSTRTSASIHGDSELIRNAN